MALIRIHGPVHDSGIHQALRRRVINFTGWLDIMAATLKVGFFQNALIRLYFVGREWRIRLSRNFVTAQPWSERLMTPGV